MRMRRDAILLSFFLTAALAAQQATTWTDPSPHRQRLVRVEPDVSVEVLDWGGSGRVVVLLAQLTQTAHIYDDWAPKLARTYRVLGITRRGFGQSSSPSNGYSMERLATDIVSVLDAEKLEDPILVGNGFAGEEMSWLGSHAPDRIAALIYLDAAYDRSNVGAEAAIARRIPSRPVQSQAMTSAQALTQWMSAGIGFPIPESEVRQLAQFGPDGRVVGQRTPPQIQQQIISRLVKIDYGSIRVPVLAIYAKRTSADAFPGCRGVDDVAVRQACGELYDWTSRQLTESEALFKKIQSPVQVVELPDAHQFVFLSNERAVMQAMDQFVSALGR